MTVRMLDGGFDDPARDAAHVFRATVQALARPGRIETVAGAQAPAPCSPAASALLLSLCDQTTGLYLAPSHDTEALRGWITFHTGAPLVEAARAMFALGTWGTIAPIDRFAIGTSEYPDRAATLIIELETLSASGAVLRGPGIADKAALSLPEIAPFQANRAQFPLGVDCFFTCGASLAGLPRSTHVSEG